MNDENQPYTRRPGDESGSRGVFEERNDDAHSDCQFSSLSKDEQREAINAFIMQDPDYVYHNVLVSVSYDSFGTFDDEDEEERKSAVSALRYFVLHNPIELHTKILREWIRLYLGMEPIYIIKEDKVLSEAALNAMYP